MARTYGPGYLSEITMPPMKLPQAEDFGAMLRQFVDEKRFKQHAVETVHEMEGGDGVDGEALDRFMEDQRPNERVDGVDDERIKMLGVGTPYFGEERDAVSRHFEVWDKVRCGTLSPLGVG